MHLLSKTALVAIYATDASHRTFLLLRIRAVMAVYAIELTTKRPLLADGLASNDTQPLLIVFIQLVTVLVRADAVLGIVMATAAADIMLRVRLASESFSAKQRNACALCLRMQHRSAHW